MAEAVDNHQARSDAAEDARDEPKLYGMVLKDLALLFGALSLWAAADAWLQVTGLWLAQLVALADGILVGVLVAALFHEWGHYAGAVASGASTRRFSPKQPSLLRFNFHFDENDVRQFHWMTAGGHVGHWSILLLLLIALPMDSIGRIALISAAFGFVVFASVIEYNIVKDTMEGEDPETRLQRITRKDFQQSITIGVLAGVFAIAALS